MKPFDLQAAQAGKPICMADGSGPVKFLAAVAHPGFVALVQIGSERMASHPLVVRADGSVAGTAGAVVMATEKHVRYAAVYQSDGEIALGALFKDRANAEERVGQAFSAGLAVATITWEA